MADEFPEDKEQLLQLYNAAIERLDSIQAADAAFRKHKRATTTTNLEGIEEPFEPESFEKVFQEVTGYMERLLQFARLHRIYLVR